MIFTFYSYKGGVGRTHLLANMAAYLCHYQNRKVLMIDWDLEAPGLHFYFGENNETVQKLGIVDLMLNFQKQRKNASEKNPLKEQDLFFPNENYIHNLFTANNGGKIDLLPAIKYEKNYNNKINAFDWLDFYENEEGYVYLSWLKEKLQDKRKYDYVFIDSRTGFNDYSGICNVLMPDMNIILVAPNEQNFEGAKTMANRIIHSPYTESKARKPFVLPILSRLDVSHPEADDWRQKFAKEFAFLIPELDDDLKNFTEEVLEQVSAKTVLEYRPKFAIGEKIQFKADAPRLPAGSDLENFENIAMQFLEEMNNTGEIDLNKIVGYKMSLILKQNIKNNSKDYESYFHLGLSYEGIENYMKAIESYKKAIEIKPDKNEAWNNLGNVYTKLENYEQVIKAFQKAIEIKPDKNEAWNNLEIVYFNLQNYNQAIESYKKAIEIKPDYHKAWNNLGFLYLSLGKLKESKESLNEALKYNSKSDTTLMNLGHISLIEKKEEQATERYKQSLLNFPNKDVFFKGMEDDFRHLEKQGVSKNLYQEIIEKLKVF